MTAEGSEGWCNPIVQLRIWCKCETHSIQETQHLSNASHSNLKCFPTIEKNKTKRSWNVRKKPRSFQKAQISSFCEPAVRMKGWGDKWLCGASYLFIRWGGREDCLTFLIFFLYWSQVTQPTDCFRFISIQVEGWVSSTLFDFTSANDLNFSFLQLFSTSALSLVMKRIFCTTLSFPLVGSHRGGPVEQSWTHTLAL